MILDQNYVNLKNQVIKAERRVLKELGFCVHVKHPHKLIVVYLKYLGFDDDLNERMLQLAWNYMNDSFRTDVFVRYQPETIACACLALAGLSLGVNMSTTPSWYVIFNVKKENLTDVMFRIHGLYSRPKADTEKLEEAVDALKKKYQDQRKKEQSNNSSPATTIVERTNGAGQNMLGFIQRQVPSVNVNVNDEKTENSSGKKHEGKLVNSTNANIISNNNNESTKGRSKSRGRSRSRSSRSRSRSRSSDRHAKKKKRTRSRSRSSESDYDRKNRKRWEHTITSEN